jgi:DNA modification methylase
MGDAEVSLPRPYYEDSGITIFHGDCRSIIPTLDPVDLLLTDPPYGIGADRNLRANKQHGKAAAPSKDYGIGHWDNTAPPAWLIGMMMEKARHHIVWGGNYFGLPGSSCWLVWDKDNGDNGYADCELAWTNLQKAVRKIRFRWMGMLQENMANKEPRWHPTQKPVEVIKWAITQAPDDCMTILDPFAGSGTTGVAAKELGRKCILIEAEEKYCEIAVKRLAQEVLPL